jgi:hypothetical protein
MDVLYYWKNMEDDLKNGRIGRFRSDKEKLEVLKGGFPDFIWIIKTPPGRFGDIQLLAKLAWSDAAPKGFSPNPGESVIYYDPHYPRSGRFDRNLSEANIERTSRWMREYFPAAVKGNFQGPNGQLELRGEPLRKLLQIASTWPTEPLV